MKRVPIGELLDLQYGKSLRKDKRVQGVYPVYGSNGIVDYHNDYLVEEPTIIVGRKGSIGEVWLSSSPCWPIDTTYYVVTKKNVSIDINWLYRLLKTLGLSKLNRSAAIPGLNRNDVYRIKIPLPPLEDQKRIASILTWVEKLIAQRKESIQLLDELLKSTFLEMFGDPVRNEKRWEKNRLNHFFKIKHGYAFKSQYFKNEGQFVLLTPGNFKEGGGYRDRGERQKYFVGEVPQDYILNENDLLIAMTEQAPGLLGSPILVPSDGIFLHNQRLGLIELKKKTNRIFLFHLFNQKSIRQIIHSKATGMKVRHTSPTKIEDILAGIPPLTMQDRFADTAEKIESIKSRYQQSLTELENLYGSLSQKAFKGELDLSRIPLPEENGTESKETRTIQIQAFQAKDKPDQKEKKSMNESELSNKIKNQFLDKLFTAEDLIESLGLAYENSEDDSVFLIDKNGKNLTLKDFLFTAINNDSKETLSLEQVFTDDPHNKRQERRVFLKVKS